MIIEVALAYKLILITASIIGFISFGYISWLLYRITKLGASNFEYPLGFLFLGLSHIWAMFLTVSSGRITYTSYIATSSFAFAGLLLLTIPKRKRIYSLLLIGIPISLDIITGMTAIYVGTQFHGKARILVRLLGLIFFLRASGAFLISSPYGAPILVLAEVSRALIAAGLAALYALSVKKG
ncbi:MAG: hypothetical protein GSR79_03060 [Desulfurococcales archaeon]|nr:hypothetical protein [Desulfurococcales archaeon]